MNDSRGRRAFPPAIVSGAVPGSLVGGAIMMIPGPFG